ncbi:MAG: DUF1801 domain-containing protein [Flavobacteriales bacterium]|jgi:hypothetical protein|nr:DUF1801 domain-containing protein [Flavobacteriales bacterium]
MASPFDPAVTSLLDASKHPLRKELDALRTIILGADARIEEGVKWNAASFRTTEWFATLNGPKQVKEAIIILHAGAKAKGMDLKGRITDPSGMIKWLGTERGMITFSSLADIKAKQADLHALIWAWIEHI